MAAPQEFRVPEHGVRYPAEILSRCTDLINTGIWSGIKVVRLRRWVKNFTTDRERYLAACILDSLIYRSDDQTTALVIQLFQRSIPDHVVVDPLPNPLSRDWLQTLRGMAEPGIRLVTAVKQADKTYKSAHIVSRLMKRQMSINPRWIVKPWEIDTDLRRRVSTFVFIDDFLGTGVQFNQLIQAESLEPLINSHYVMYAPFAAHEKGVADLKTLYPTLRVVASENLDKGHGLFNVESRCFDDGTNTPESALEYYTEVLSRKGIAVRDENRIGFGGLGLAYVFEQAVSDNNLPLLWKVGNHDWEPLFPR
jgi:hypothetical protein